jgi:hypothetical protein
MFPYDPSVVKKSHFVHELSPEELHSFQKRQAISEKRLHINDCLLNTYEAIENIKSHLVLVRSPKLLIEVPTGIRYVDLCRLILSQIINETKLLSVLPPYWKPSCLPEYFN